jgi:RNA polymerase sigma-70 factor (ECF subfamily)
MDTTSCSLLGRLQNAAADAPEWQKFYGIYRPLVHSWLARVPGASQDIDDLTQDVMLVLCRELPRFERRRDGAFRAWLRQITVNRIYAFYKTRKKQPNIALDPQRDAVLAQLSDPHSDLSRQWDLEHDKQVFRSLLAVVQPDFSAATWQAFTKFALEGCSAAQVSQQLGISEGAVMQAKFRILKRLRQEAEELVD